MPSPFVGSWSESLAPIRAPTSVRLRNWTARVCDKLRNPSRAIRLAELTL
jgi:hypothetical protein